jgi:tetratricopeptide (TPR) repeat protein
MDRSVVAAYAVLMLPFGALLGAGCDSRGGRANPGSSASPAVLAELGQSSPGPWRRLADAPVVTAQEGVADSQTHQLPGCDRLESATACDSSDAADDNREETAVAIGATDDPPADETGLPLRSAGPTIQFADPPQVPDDAEGAAVPIEFHSTGQAISNADADGTPRVATQESIKRAQIADCVAVETTQRSSLPWAGSQPRTTEMTAAVRRADERARRGFELAQRGALYSARSEYIAALQIIAQANDAQQSTQFFSKALASGLRALVESSDFVRQNPRKPETEVASIVARHTTPILKGAALEQMAPLAAANRYYTFAQEQLAAASSREVTGSMALFGLGKVTVVAIGNQGSQRMERTAQAIVLFQAAVLADPKNFRAANELGVLLAETGNLSRARAMLLESAALSSEATTWHNLAVVHARLGENQLADRAQAQAIALGHAAPVGSVPQVQWVDPTTFAGTSSVTEGSIRPATPAKASGKPADAPTSNEKPAAATAKKGVSYWLPWNARR